MAGASASCLIPAGTPGRGSSCQPQNVGLAHATSLPQPDLPLRRYLLRESASDRASPIAGLGLSKLSWLAAAIAVAVFGARPRVPSTRGHSR